MFAKISVKVAILVNLVLLAVMAAGSYYVVTQQGATLEQQLFQRGRIESITGAKMIGRVLEEAIDNGVFSVDDAFDTNYVLIPGFEPAKYHTKYDTYLDKAILSLQDEFLKDDSVNAACAVDINGYLPTHNSRFQQPITGDQELDKAGNRTKRIFNDPIGLQAAVNTQPGFQQIYKRDVGTDLWDFSTPIYVKGKQWGGFRVNLSLEKIEQAKSVLMTKLLLIMGGILVISLGMVFLVVGGALRPLKRFTRIAADLADGRVNQQIEVKGRDEIAQLAAVLERLRLSLKIAMERLGRKG
jgi:methyl-accepting chemotaxis protein